ncbi:ArsR/SmtB family transcription factor [Leucobacter edaphi]|uniref:ArsR/SmtB family transcription factor n=1 Tax=Leucobacter edaphi TaxID=2796472 RepID=UPI0034E1E58C
MTRDYEGLRRKLDALSDRVAQLEAAHGGARPPGAKESAPYEAQPPKPDDGHRPPPDEAQPPTLDAETFWALHGVQQRLAGDPSTRGGAVMIVGSLTLPNGGPVAWHQIAGSDGLLTSDWSDQALSFSALGHPVRLELLRHILAGVHATADLAEVTALGTTGQLHHHLRQLLAAGWVRQSGRGSYEVPAARVVPLLACLTGSWR